MTLRARNDIAIVEVAVVVEAALYATGDNVGGKLSLLNAVNEPEGGIIEWVALTDKAGQAADMDVLFFTADPTNSTFTENAAIAIDVDDVANALPVVQLTTHIDVGTPSISQAVNLGLEFVLKEGTTLFAVLVARAGPTYASTSDLTLRVGILGG